MLRKFTIFLTFLIFSISFHNSLSASKNRSLIDISLNDPDQLSFMKLAARIHLIPDEHPMKVVLDNIFLNQAVLENEQSFRDAGFEILFSQPSSYIKVAKHPLLPNYLVKVYLDSEKRIKRKTPGWIWLTQRCLGAAKIRKLINRKKITHFTVPDKYLYALPSAQKGKQRYILLVTDMQLASHHEIHDAWRNKITKKHLNELYYILSHGAGSNFLSGNIPYCKNGKFAFIDTEYPNRKITLEKVKTYLSPEMQQYWDKLIRSGGPKKK